MMAETEKRETDSIGEHDLETTICRNEAEQQRKRKIKQNDLGGNRWAVST